ncbi:MAG TPA: hypothetical protein PLP33_24835 [Leptospiraceae bacterium]|nr:hypothetical protein [Leptospiraceae bacterium]
MFAKEFAINQHDLVNQSYDDRSYALHLELVQFNLLNFIEILKKSEFKTEIEKMQTVAWLHDVLEDTNTSYNDLKKLFDGGVAEEVFLLTEEKGRNRAERHNHKYMTGVASSEVASLVKISDIAANASYSLFTGSSMYKKYKNEFPSVRYYLQHSNTHLYPIFQKIQDFFDSNSLDSSVEKEIVRLRALYPIRHILILNLDSDSSKEKCLLEIQKKYKLI